jgi:hypothetical protein
MRECFLKRQLVGFPRSEVIGAAFRAHAVVAGGPDKIFDSSALV